MSTNPKKSKAFLITFIIVIVLLLIGYFVFRQSGQLFGTKNSTAVTKSFTPLLGTSGQKPLSTSATSTQTNGGNTTTNILNGTDQGINPVDNSIPAQGVSSSSGLGTKSGLKPGSFGATGGVGAQSGLSAVVPPMKSLPTPSSTYGNTGNVLPSPLPNPDPRVVNPNPTFTPPVVNPNQCPSDPLVFTDAEKIQLADLLKQYYLIAPSLKNADDIALIDNDITTNQGIIGQATTLTLQCQAQKSNPSYTGPQTVKDNPYYRGGSTGTFYIPDFSQLEQAFNIW